MNNGTMQRQYAFTQLDYDRVAQLLYRIAGIHLGDSRMEMVYSRLARELRRLNQSSVRDYLDFLEKAGQNEWTRFVNVLTTNLTSFFREQHHFDILKQKILPHASRPARIWSCGCASGEEPYSIAMTCLEYFNDVPGMARIFATDINTAVLQGAEAGVFELDRVESLPVERRRRFFLAGSGAYEGKVKVKDKLRQCIDFRMLNLMHEQWNVEESFDAIFCRNVMIYFDKATQYRILKRFAPLLKQPHGMLFAGHSEAFFHAKDIFAPLGSTTYRVNAA